MSGIVCLSTKADSMKVFCTLGGCVYSFMSRCLNGCKYQNMEVRDRTHVKNDTLGQFLVLTLAQEV